MHIYNKIVPITIKRNILCSAWCQMSSGLVNNRKIEWGICLFRGILTMIFHVAVSRKCVCKTQSLTQCWFNIGTTSTTLAQHWPSIGSKSCASWGAWKTLIYEDVFITRHTWVPMTTVTHYSGIILRTSSLIRGWLNAQKECAERMRRRYAQKG